MSGGRPGRPSARGRRSADRVTRAAVLWLAGTALLALLVPALPLASPSVPALDRRLAPPGLSPFWREGGDRHEAPRDVFLGRPLAALRTTIFGDGHLGPVLGTDALGRCVLSRTLWGARLTLAVAFVASAITLVIGVVYGAVAGYAGGRADSAMMRVVDVLQSLPLMFIVIFVVSFLRALRQADPASATSPVFALFAVIGAVSWLVMARIVRAQVASLRTADFILAARASGATPLRILRRHVVPNVAPIAIATLTLTIPRVMLLEAFLSFLGLGVESPDVSWGLLSRQGFDAITAVDVAWWIVLFPGLALASTLLAFNLAGDGLRDAIDPRLRGLRR